MSVAMDDQTAAPASGSVGSFAAMLRMAMEMGLEVPAVSQADVRDRLIDLHVKEQHFVPALLFVFFRVTYGTVELQKQVD